MTLTAKIIKIARYAINDLKPYFTVPSQKCLLPSRIYVPKYYKYRMGTKMNVSHPKKLSEKLNWYKLYYKDPLFTICADKYRMREYVKMRLGDGYTVPVIAKWNSADEIDFEKLPDRFVLKTNHDGKPVICFNKKDLDTESVRNCIAQKLTNEYWKRGREWAYKDIKKCVFAEELLSDGKNNGYLIDYKFFCFCGQPIMLYTVSENVDEKHGHIDYFDMNFNPLPFKHHQYSRATVLPQKPENFSEMVEIAKALSSYGEGIPFVRVDMYSVNGKIYVGELTFYPTNGMVKYDPPEYDSMLGEKFVLPQKNGWKRQKGRDAEWVKKTLSAD